MHGVDSLSWKVIGYNIVMLRAAATSNISHLHLLQGSQAYNTVKIGHVGTMPINESYLNDVQCLFKCL